MCGHFCFCVIFVAAVISLGRGRLADGRQLRARHWRGRGRCSQEAMVRGFLGVQPRGIFWGSGSNRTSKFYYGRKDDTAWNHDLVCICVWGD